MEAPRRRGHVWGGTQSLLSWVNEPSMSSCARGDRVLQSDKLGKSVLVEGRRWG